MWKPFWKKKSIKSFLNNNERERERERETVNDFTSVYLEEVVGMGFEGDGTQSETGLKWFPNSMEIFMTLVVTISSKGCCNSGLTP